MEFGSPGRTFQKDSANVNKEVMEMYINNDICYAGQLEEGIKITRVKPLCGRMLLVTFSTGEKRLFDTTILKGSAFNPLDDENIFQDIHIFHGVITWLDGEIDVAPEKVYMESFAYESIENKQLI